MDVAVKVLQVLQARVLLTVNVEVHLVLLVEQLMGCVQMVNALHQHARLLLLALLQDLQALHQDLLLVLLQAAPKELIDVAVILMLLKIVLVVVGVHPLVPLDAHVTPINQMDV